MIVKDPDYQAGIDKLKSALNIGNPDKDAERELRWLLAGMLAEQQMAYQLRSYFTDYVAVYVLNNLRIEHGGVTAQVDHLVFSRRAMYFIESKSVSGELSVNEHGEWFRKWGQKCEPMDSPVEQVKRQRQVLLQFMEVNVRQFLGRVLGIQKQIGLYTVKEYVSVSQKGIISGPGRGSFQNVKKYDQVADAILQFHQSTATGILGNLTAKKDEEYNLLSLKELKALSQFFLSHDRSQTPLEIATKAIGALVRGAAPSAPASTAAATSAGGRVPSARSNPPPLPPPAAIAKQTFKCKDCGSQSLLMRYRFSYHFNCQACGSNMPVNVVCSSCGQKERVIQSDRQFHRVCEACNKDEIFFENPPEPIASPPPPSPSAPPSDSASSKICPRCGAAMIVRTGKRGQYAEKRFWGCSTFPKCRAMEEIEPKSPGAK